LVTSEFLKRFNELAEAGLLHLKSNTLLVEVLPKQEIKSSGGILLTTTNAQVGSAQQMASQTAIVLAIGKGFNPDAYEVPPLDVKPGAVIKLPTFGLEYVSTYPGIDSVIPQYKLAFVERGSVVVAYPSIEEYERARSILNLAH